MQVAQKYFSFAEIVQGRDSYVRVTHDGLLYAVDLVMVMTGKSRDDAGKVLRRLTDDIFRSDQMSERRSDIGGHPTKLLTFQNALELVMVLPGRVAKETRTQFANIIRRYLAGDHSMISKIRKEKHDQQRMKIHGYVYMIESDAFPNFVKIGRDLSLLSEIQANAASAAPVAQMARESLGIATEEDLIRKRRREDLELEKLHVEIQDRRRQSVVTHVNSYMETMESLDAGWKKDQRLVVQLKDLLTNVTLGHKLIGDAKEGNSSDEEAIYISMLARELGYSKLSHGEDCRIGKELARLYREKHGKEPPTCKRLVNGTEMTVKHYTARDRDLMEEAICNVMDID